MAHRFLHLIHSKPDDGVAVFSSPLRNECPGNFTCTGINYTKLETNVPTYFSLISCSLSVVGSLLIFISYFALKGIRNVAQKIITALAVADLFTALGYILAGWNTLANSSSEKCPTFKDVCQVQSFITSWSSLSSFGWSCALALHFYLLLKVKQKSWLAKLFYWENLFLWLSPLVVLVPLLVTNWLGYSLMAVSNWCFIRSNNNKKLETALVFLGGKLWEILSYIFVGVAYTLTTRKVKKHVRTEGGSSEDQPILPPGWREEQQVSPAQEARSGARQRLHIIPLLFVLLRMWGTLQLLFIMIRANDEGCVSTSTDITIIKLLAIAQAIGDGGQGWGNALVYIFLSPTIRRQLFWQPVVRAVVCIMRWRNRHRKEIVVQHFDNGGGDVGFAAPRRFTTKEDTRGVQGTSYSELGEEEEDDEGDVYGKDSGVDAEMSTVTK